jgi:hypothetical protein
MKSHSCEKPIGGVVPLTPEPITETATSDSVTSEPVTREPATRSVNLTRCRNIDRLNRHCRMFSSSPDLELCPHHARQHRQRSQRLNDKDANDLLGDLEDFSTPEAVNALLGNLVRQLARKRISRLDAVAIAYVSQLLLGSISSMDRHNAALRAAEDATTDDFPSRIIFDPPEPISDTARIAAAFATSRPPEPQNPEGRA